jgi:CBS domain containing-hemolysin-like protein
MEGLFLEVFLIALLILLNGYLAGTEIAVVTARKSTNKRWPKVGKEMQKSF